MAIADRFPYTLRSPGQEWSWADWQDSEACAALRFLANGVVDDMNLPVRTAKQLCYDCPLTQACLQWAMDTKPGAAVLGGCTEAERIELAEAAEQTRRLLTA